jgi:transposase
MREYTEAFIGIDAAKSRNAIAVAEAGRLGEVRWFGEIDASPESMRRAIDRIAQKYDEVHVCYEAGPTGYGLHRMIRAMGHDCAVAAPSMVPKKPGDRVKTNRRDATALARLLRAGELTSVWVPDEAHEAMRDLVRARLAAVESLRACRQQVSGFMLRQGRIYPGKKGWTLRYEAWAQRQAFEHRPQQLALGEMLQAVRSAKAALKRLEVAVAAEVETWSMAPVVRAFQALRGVDLIAAATLTAELGELGRFASPRGLMAYVGLVPSEHSTGKSVVRGAITKAGNRRARQMLVQCAWTYRHPPRVGAKKQARIDQVTPAVAEIAWKAQARLHGRYKALIRRGKKKNVVCTALARELVGFLWAIAREVGPMP